MSTHFDDLMFVCLENDSQAVQCVRHLQSLGYKGSFLKDGEKAPIGSIAMYTGNLAYWPSRNLRVAAHRLVETCPSWALTTPFVVAIRPGAKGQMLKAAQELAEMYIRWSKGEVGAQVPWETRNGRPCSKEDLIEGWMDQVAQVIGEQELTRILESQKIDKNKHVGRGGDIVFRVLGPTGKVVTSPDGLANSLPANQAYQRLTGLKLPPVSYGTSDLANFFELLQAIKLGEVLGLPVVFETYPGAHDVAHWISGFLNPSLKILGAKVWSTDITDERAAKFNTVITAEKMARIIKSGKLEWVGDILMSWAGQPMWVIYQNAMQHAANTILQALGISVDFRFTTTEEICKQTGLWEMKLADFSNLLKQLSDHDVVVYNDKTGRQVKTNEQMPDWTIEQLHQNGGWLGGAGLYYMVYNLSEFGGVVVMVKDSTRGRVNLMAKPFLEKDAPLRLAPVGLFRLSAEDQLEDWAIDPLVMMELLVEWGPEMTKENARMIWDHMEVPLLEKNVGRKTVAKVTRSGVQVRVQEA